MPDQRIPNELRQQVIERAGGCCEYCRSQARYATQSFSVEHSLPRSVEHSLPRSKDGTTTLDNLALACQGCNNHKYDKAEAADPVNGQLVPLYHPRRDQSETHFAWSNGFTLILGITPTGRAAVDALLLNREGVVNLRRILYAHGEHPPRVPAASG